MRTITDRSRRAFLRHAAMTAGALAVSPALSARADERVVPPSKSQQIEVRDDIEIATIRPELHGQFIEHLGSCIYGGLWVGPESPLPNVRGIRADALRYLQALGVPVLRWPGGCFADDYHWRDGIGPVKDRPRTLNMNWGHVVEPNSFGTHEFMDLCRLLGAQPYLAGNVGSAPPEELRDWVEYCNYPSGTTLSDLRIRNGAREPFRVKYWGVGNESWGCGGNMRPQYYGELFRRYSSFLPSVGGTDLYLIASGPSGDDVRWTRGLLDTCADHLPDGLSMHYYEGGAAAPTDFTGAQATAQFRIFHAVEAAIRHQREVLNGYRNGDQIGLILDEWGVWDAIPQHDPHGELWQQSTMRSAVAAGLGLNLFNRNADRLYMCNIAQMVNVLQSLLLTDGAHGKSAVRTTTYYAFLLFKGHRGNMALSASNDDASPDAVSVSASRAPHGRLLVSMVNPSVAQAVTATVAFRGVTSGSCRGQLLHATNLNSYNSFEKPDTVTPSIFVPHWKHGRLVADLPPLSVATVTVDAHG